MSLARQHWIQYLLEITNISFDLCVLPQEIQSYCTLDWEAFLTYFQPVAGTRVSWEVQFPNSSKTWEWFCANHFSAPRAFFCWDFPCKSLCMNQWKKIQQWVLLSLHLIWYISIITYLSKSTQVMTPVYISNESLRRTGQITIRLHKVEVIASSSKLPVLPHRVLQMPLIEGMHRSIISQVHHLHSNLRLPSWSIKGEQHLPLTLKALPIFFLHAGLATIIHFALKPDCYKTCHFNNTLMPDLLDGHLLCSNINHLDLHLKEGWQNLGHVILSLPYHRRRAWSKKHSPLPPKMLCRNIKGAW